MTGGRGDAPAEFASWCEIDAAALRANVDRLRQRLTPGALLGVVVKSHAYGHGLVLCAQEFMSAGVDWLVVNTVDEAVSLREAGIQAPLYICSQVLSACADQVAQTRARVVLCDPENARVLARAGQEGEGEVKVHIKLETGISRQGLCLKEALELARLVEGLEGIALEGLTTHYADSDNTVDHTFAQRQFDLLEEGRRAFAEEGMPLPMVHSANSAATLLWPETHGSLVRVGIAAYGLWPSREAFATALQRESCGQDCWRAELTPALTWRARLSQVKEVQAGAYIGYGRTFRATRPMRIGILPVGYFEGYDRRLSNAAHVLVDGVRASVLGRVCMNMTIIDVTRIPQVESGTVVTLLGRERDEEVSADQWAAWLDSINYEAVTRIHPGQPRLLRGEDGVLSPREVG